MSWVFCYGSNNPDQLAGRLGRGNLRVERAHLNGYERVFRGFSRNWGGGTASLVRKTGGVVYGYVALLSAEDLDALDRFEGVALGIYKRSIVSVSLDSGTKVKAVAYVHNSNEFNPPSRPYLEAVAKTIGTFWRGSGGSAVKPSDIPIR